MVSTAIQLFTVCEADASLASIVDRIERAGYDGVELNEEWFPLCTGSGTPERDDSSALSLRKIGVAGTQVPIKRLDTDLENVLETYTDLPCRDFVIPYLDEECFSTHANTISTARKLTTIAERLAEANCRLHYHNHHFEFTAVDGRLAYDLLVEEVDGVRFELDVGWAAAAGEDPVTLLKRYGDLIDLVHVKDMAVETETPADLGDGDVDLEACIDAAGAADVNWVIYEYDWPAKPLASLDHGGEWLGQRVR